MLVIMDQLRVTEINIIECPGDMTVYRDGVGRKISLCDIEGKVNPLRVRRITENTMKGVQQTNLFDLLLVV